MLYFRPNIFFLFMRTRLVITLALLLSCNIVAAQTRDTLVVQTLTYDSLARAGRRANREAEAERQLAELKKRMGK